MNTLQSLLPKPSRPLGLVKEYMYYYRLCKQHFDKVVVLYQNGSFYEMFQPKHTDLLELATIMVVKIAWKKSMKPEQPYNIGFPISAKLKYVKILLEHSYTVVVIDQIGDPQKGSNLERLPSVVYSPGTVPLDLEFVSNEGTDSILSVYAYTGGISAVSMNLQTGSSTCSVGKDLEFLYSFVNTIGRVSEVSLFIHKDLDDNKDYSSDNILVYLDLLTVQSKRTVVSNKLGSDDFEAVFKQIWPTLDTGMSSIVEYLGLTYYPTISQVLLYTFDFINQRNPHYLRSLEIPQLVFEQERLLLTTNTVNQLNVLPNKLFEKVNVCKSNRYDSLASLVSPFVCTAIGRRALKDLLARPLVNTTELAFKYDLSDRLGDVKGLKGELSKVYDIVRLCRRVSLGVIGISELVQLKRSFHTILNIVDLVQDGCGDLVNLDWVESLRCTLELIDKTCTLDCPEDQEESETSDLGINDTFFLPGVYPDLDCVLDKIKNFKSHLLEIAKEYSKVIDSKGKVLLKLAHTDQDSWHLTCTRPRALVLQKQITRTNIENDLDFHFLKSSCKLKSKRIDSIASEYDTLVQDFNKIFNGFYSEFLGRLGDSFHDYLHMVVQFIELVDLAHTNSLLVSEYRYTRPTVSDCKNGSSVSFKGLRNPLGERVCETKWASHDITLGRGDPYGILLYGINAAGKSMLLRSIGMCIVLAQSGFYVPCESMDLCVYKKIVSQVELYDNFLKGQSSFMVEVSGIRSVLNMADQFSLVLADELCKGTESTSGAALLGSLLYTLVERKASFLITTHLHQLVDVDLIRKLPGLRICHLSVSQASDGGGVVFDRQLYDGGSSVLYGLKIAEYMNLDKTFVNIAQGISDSISGFVDPNVGRLDLKPTKSRYNTKKKTLKCEVCGYKPTTKKHIPLDTHHIDFQCNANDSGFIGDYHKNELFNLVTLCKECHTSVHSGKLEISGYQSSNKGVRLAFSRHPISASLS